MLADVRCRVMRAAGQLGLAAVAQWTAKEFGHFDQAVVKGRERRLSWSCGRAFRLTRGPETGLIPALRLAAHCQGSVFAGCSGWHKRC